MVSLLKAEYKRLFSNVFFYVVLVLSVGVNLAVLIEELLVLKENSLYLVKKNWIKEKKDLRTNWRK